MSTPNPTPAPKAESRILKIRALPTVLLSHTLSFLAPSDAHALSISLRKKEDVKAKKVTDEHSKAVQAHLTKEKENYDIAHELLQYVLDANPEAVKAFFERNKKEKEEKTEKAEKSDKKCPVLTRTCGREEYISLQKIDNEHQKVDENSRIVRDKKTGKLVKIVCKRKWGHISPLEAAALSGDNFLVNILLEQVPPHLKREAALQLRGVLNRTGYAENGGYLAPYKALIKAYEEYTPTNWCPRTRK